MNHDLRPPPAELGHQSHPILPSSQRTYSPPPTRAPEHTNRFLLVRSDHDAELVGEALGGGGSNDEFILRRVHWSETGPRRHQARRGSTHQNECLGFVERVREGRRERERDKREVQGSKAGGERYSETKGRYHVRQANISARCVLVRHE